MFPLTLPARIKFLVTLPLLALLFATPLRAQGQHGHGHDALHHWYQSLNDKTGRSCCSGIDCRPTQSRVTPSGIEVTVDGEWTPVPADKILDKASPDLGSHVCSPLQPSPYPKGHIFCVVLGSGV